MIFALRSLMVGLAFFGVLYCLLSLLVACVWQTVNFLRQNTVPRFANPLFALRIFPALAAALLTFTLALPAFFRLEGGMDEDMGTFLFSAGTFLLLAAGAFRVFAARSRAFRTIAQFLDGAQLVNTGAPMPAFRSRAELPPLLLYGISAPKVLISDEAVAALSSEGLRVAVRHEIAHLQSRDNLKKLLLHTLPFPGMKSLERAWLQAAELAADEAAVSNSEEAVDLAEALLKLCSLAPAQEPPAFTTGLLDMSALVNFRVRRLLAWSETSAAALSETDARNGKRLSRSLVLAVLISVPYTLTHYSQALLLTHRATEWFIH